MKVLSCKVSDDLYNFIDKMEKSNSEILRLALKEYIMKYELKPSKNSGIPKVYHKTKDDLLNTIHNYIDRLETPKFVFNNDSDEIVFFQEVKDG